MYCINCGKEIDNDSKFCCFCGKEVAITIEENANKTLSDIDEPLFLKQLVGREKLEKGLWIATKVLEVVAFFVMALYLYEQYQLDEGYVFWIYILRFMVRFASLMLILGTMQFFSELLRCRITDLRRPELKNTWLVCKIGILLADLVMTYPFIEVSDATLAGWILRFAFVGIDEFFYEFRLQWLAYLVSIIIGVYIDKCVEMKKDN